MIRKFLLIGESGLLQFYLSQDEINIDRDLLSGFCTAIHSISLELKSPLKNIDFANQTMLIENIDHVGENRRLLLAALFDEYHIDEALKYKLKYIYENHFKDVKFGDETKRLNNEALDREISNVLNDVKLNQYITENLGEIKGVLDPIMENPENAIIAYCLCSSTNNILYFNASDSLVQDRSQDTPLDIIKGYLMMWKMSSIPQGDKFIGLDLPTGLDLVDFVKSGQKTLGIVINTCINLKEEPNNELLLYLFGKNALMRSCVLTIEDDLRECFDRSNNMDDALFYTDS